MQKLRVYGIPPVVLSSDSAAASSEEILSDVAESGDHWGSNTAMQQAHQAANHLLQRGFEEVAAGYTAPTFQADAESESESDESSNGTDASEEKSRSLIFLIALCVLASIAVVAWVSETKMIRTYGTLEEPENEDEPENSSVEEEQSNSNSAVSLCTLPFPLAPGYELKPTLTAAETASATEKCSSIQVGDELAAGECAEFYRCSKGYDGIVAIGAESELKFSGCEEVVGSGPAVDGNAKENGSVSMSAAASKAPQESTSGSDRVRTGQNENVSAAFKTKPTNTEVVEGPFRLSTKPKKVEKEQNKEVVYSDERLQEVVEGGFKVRTAEKNQKVGNPTFKSKEVEEKQKLGEHTKKHVTLYV